ncbi:uncharacterized protein F4812DRAFT_455359 [Daldinia caldariorum]|uniref:uncharacterized protein n=1 Tax=Daldinia caldariorum TaxID=326644 RepID=UPI002008A113|nr:uncharacterized protein F4812DRAFT_455359 [Daldinia caldariorum]KAI1471247.1 hypothetical protein F4812DRAFT_455359 [Daldinia caldariorum]
MVRRPLITTSEWCYCAICGGPFEPTYFISEKSMIGCGYDPKVISKRGAAWVTEVRLLLESISAEKKGYISGRGKYNYLGYIELDGTDAENLDIPSTFNYTCYKYDSEPQPLGAIPFHWPCYEILARRIYPDVNKPVQHVDLSRLYREYFTGEEYFIANPAPSAELTLEIAKIIVLVPILKPLPLVDLSSRVIDDPFENLGDDIIFNICLYLRAEGIIALARAS